MSGYIMREQVVAHIALKQDYSNVGMASKFGLTKPAQGMNWSQVLKRPQ